MTQQIRVSDGVSLSDKSRFCGTMSGRKPIERLLRSGQPLFHEGDDARYVFEVKAGVLRQTRSLETGERQVVGFHFPGDVVGFSPESIHRTGCTAITDGRALIHPATDVTQPGHDPELHERLLTAALHEIATAQEQLVMLGRRSAVAKLGAFLQYLGKRIGVWRDGYLSVDIAMSRNDIADFLGIAVETVSRMLTELRCEGVINLDDPHRLLVLRPAALGDLS